MTARFELRLFGVLATAVSAALTTGCPLSDGYYVEQSGGSGGSVKGRPGPGPGPGASGTPGSSGSGAWGGFVNNGSGGTTNESAGAGEVCSASEACNGLDDDCDGQIDEDGACPTGCSAKVFAGHVYLLCLDAGGATASSHLDANGNCAAAAALPGLSSLAGLELVSVQSAEEENFLKSWLTASVPGDGDVWLGASDVLHEGTWTWGSTSSSETFFTAAPMGGGMAAPGHFQDFAPGKPDADSPDEDCGIFAGKLGYRWDDARCNAAAAGYVCESTP